MCAERNIAPASEDLWTVETTGLRRPVLQHASGPYQPTAPGTRSLAVYLPTTCYRTATYDVARQRERPCDLPSSSPPCSLPAGDLRCQRRRASHLRLPLWTRAALAFRQLQPRSSMAVIDALVTFFPTRCTHVRSLARLGKLLRGTLITVRIAPCTSTKKWRERLRKRPKHGWL